MRVIDKPIPLQRRERARSWRRALRAAVHAIVLLGAFAAGGVLWLRQTVAPLSGSLTLPGLGSPVDVLMGPDAVPHIFSGSIDDAYMALGFLHAQNRMWQMELMRRSGQGRLSEVFGSRSLDRDKLMRTLDLYGHARRSIDRLSPEARAALDAYARGVNAWLERRTGPLEPRLPPEFLLLWHKPEPWQPTDSLVILKQLSLQLSRNLDKEIDRLTFAALGLSPAEIEDLLPTQTQWGAPPLPDIRALYPLRQPPLIAPRRRAGLDVSPSDGASNNWVVSGALTRSGKPLLAGDPHLRLSAPSIWYLVHMAVADGAAANLVGASLPGTPLVPLGRGDTFAWALTNAETDVQDLFVERVNPDNPRQYQTPTGWQDFGRETIAIRVRGSEDVVMERLTTRHGPVISSVYRAIEGILAPGHVAALQWTSLSDDDTTIEAGLFEPSLRTVRDAIDRTRPTVGPMQSMVVADTKGDIGFIAPGRLPVRDPSNAVSGRAPVPGWLAQYDWRGYVTFEALPRLDNPAANAIGTTNTRIVAPDFPHLLTWDWGPAYRQQRYEQLIPGRRDHDVASMRTAQLDVHSSAAARLAPLMIAAARSGSPSPRAARELDAVAAWDGGMRADIAEPLIFIAWMRQALDAVWRDDLGDAASLSPDERVATLIRLLEGLPTARDWCDDRTTTAIETCGQTMALALEGALADLDQRFGKDRRKWRWDDAHYADGLHEPLGRLPLIGRFFNVRIPSSGGPFTLNRGKTDLASPEPYANRGATTFRAIYDLADLEASIFIQSTGQSGNPFSPHYRSFAGPWSKGGYITIPTQRAAIERQLAGRWRLTP